jgi:hypothetical protein
MKKIVDRLQKFREEEESKFCGLPGIAKLNSLKPTRHQVEA